MLLHQTFERTARQHGERNALTVGGMHFSYNELARRTQRLAAGLQARGVRRGDRVAIFMENGVDAVVAYYATLAVGAVMMPINPLTKEDKLRYILQDATPSCVIAEARLHRVYEPALTGVASVHTCVVAGNTSAAAGERGAPDPRLVRYSDLLRGDAVIDDAGTIDQDLAAIIYTSGSTGDPKGVMLSHRNMLAAQDAITTYLGLRSDDVIFCALPLAFDYGLYQILMAFGIGARVVLERSFAYPAQALTIMARERVTVFPGVPTSFNLLLNFDGLAHYELSCLRLLTNTAAALAESHIAQIRALFPRAQLFSMYGLTECKRVTYLPPAELDRRPTSVGRGMPNEEVYLVDEEGRRLPNGSVGQLVVRGGNVMRGYWNKPEQTAKRLKPGPIPGEMVLYTGDIFRTDADGFLYFIARSDDIIKTRGEKVSPREVENVLYGMEEVLEAAVIGVPDALLGQAVKAFVVLKPGVVRSERDVIRYCGARLENFMAPKYVEFVSELPKTNTGKIRKTGLNGDGVSPSERDKMDAVACAHPVGSSTAQPRAERASVLADKEW